MPDRHSVGNGGRVHPFTMRTLLTLSAFICAIGMAAQERERPMTLSLNGHVGHPLGEFGEAWGREFYGVGGNFSTPFKRLPFEGGFQFDWSHMGGETAVVPVNEDYLDATEGDLTVNSNIYSFHALMRFKPFTGKVAPYVDGLAGWRTFSTRTKLKVDGVEGPLTNERNAMDAAWSYGWAAGLMVTLGETFYLEGRYEKYEGSEVTYVDPSSIVIDSEGAVGFGTQTSNTDAYAVKLGFGFRF